MNPTSTIFCDKCGEVVTGATLRHGAQIIIESDTVWEKNHTSKHSELCGKCCDELRSAVKPWFPHLDIAGRACTEKLDKSYRR